LEKAHNPLRYQKNKELTQFQVRCDQGIKSKDGKVLHEDADILQRWADYVVELYHDDRSKDESSTETEEECVIMEEEVKVVIEKLTRRQEKTIFLQSSCRVWEIWDCNLLLN